MRIACLGWGSLIWDPRKLKLADKWLNDGPELPIEFARISGNNRVTLIIDHHAQPVQTLWAPMSLTELENAVENLRKREHTTGQLIHTARKDEQTTDPIKQIIKNWLIGKNLDAAIWTGLSYSDKTKNTRPSIQEIITHLESLNEEDMVMAKEYIVKTPEQINTQYRQTINNHFGW